MPKPRRKNPARSLRPTPRQAIALAAGLAVGLVAGAHALAMATRTVRPQVALGILPGEPVALARQAQAEMIAALQDKRQLPPRDAAVRQSLAGQAINPLALRLLALPETMPIERNVDYRLVALANETSRRDFPTQALLIQQGGETNDLPKVLRAYDAALRTKGESQSLLFPPLLKAVEMPAMAPHFARYLRERPPWLSDFLVYAVGASENPAVLARQFRANGGVGKLDRAPEIETGIVNRLVAHKQDYAEARRAYLASTGAQPAMLASPAIRPASVKPAANALVWQLYDQPGRGAEALAERAISAFAEPGRSGPVAQKVLYLAPGSYRLKASYEDVRFGDGGKAAWSVVCAGRGAQSLGGGPVPARTGSFDAAFDFAVPAGCPAAILILELTGGRDSAGSELLIDALALGPARPRASGA